MYNEKLILVVRDWWDQATSAKYVNFTAFELRFISRVFELNN